MRILVTGASGALGRRLTPLLVYKGHDVVAMTHAPANAAALRAAGARTVVADGLDREAVMRTVRQIGPEVVVHQMTSLAGVTNLKNFDAAFEVTNRLRTRGTDNLLAAMAAAGACRIIAQSYGSWIYAPVGAQLKTERDPLDPNPPAKQRRSLAAIRHLEGHVTATAGITGLALRYGGFYGPGTALAPDGDVAGMVRKRLLPIIGNGCGVWSFIHIDDAAAATVAAVEGGPAGIYNITDDEPAPVSAWLPELARVLGAKAPFRLPVWLGRLVAGDAVVSMMTAMRGMANSKAARELGWRPHYRSWRDGFAAEFGRPADGARAALNGARPSGVTSA